MLSETRQICTFSILQSHESLQCTVSGWDRNRVTTVSTYVSAINDFNMTALMHAAQTVWAHKEHNTAAVMNVMSIVPHEVRKQRHSHSLFPHPFLPHSMGSCSADTYQVHDIAECLQQ